MIISGSIDVTKIDKSTLKEVVRKDGTRSVYLNITFLENRNGQDKYGNDFMVTQDIGKERRQAGEKGPILGNGRFIQRDRNSELNRAGDRGQRQERNDQRSGDINDDIPF